MKHSERPHVALTVTFLTRQSSTHMETAHEVAWFQAYLKGPEKGAMILAPKQHSTDISTRTQGSVLTVSSPAWTFEFDRARGYLRRWTADGLSLLEPDPEAEVAVTPSMWRPPTDNDVPLSLPYWQRFGVDNLTSQLRSFNTTVEGDSVVIEATTFISPPVLDWGWTCTITYRIHDSGELDMDVKLSPSGSIPKHVPRIGLDLRVSKALDRVRWYGLGPGESYPDKKSAQRAGIWEVDSVAELQTPYDVPQENGNRMETGWAALSDGHGRGLRASIGAGSSNDGMRDGFSWVASRHSTRAIESAKHPCDLVEDDAVLLRLDAKVAGVGTAACGPGVREDLLVKVEKTEFSFKLARLGF